MSSKVDKVGLLDVNDLVLDSFVLGWSGGDVTESVELLLEILFPGMGFY